MFSPIDVCGALQYASSQVLFGILQMAVTVRIVADRGRFSWAIDCCKKKRAGGGGGSTFLARLIRNAGGAVRFHFHFRARYKERASAGKWRPAIPAVNFGPAYDPPWAWLCGPGLHIWLAYIYQTATKLRNRNSSYNQPAYNFIGLTV